MKKENWKNLIYRFAPLLAILFGFFQIAATTFYNQKVVQPDVEQLVQSIQNSPNKGEIELKIIKVGKDAIPVLINHLQDSKLVGSAYMNRGECYNLPPLQTLPATCNKEQKQKMGEWCEDMLYRILTPAYVSSSEPKEKGKLGMNQPFVIRDWIIWWNKNAGHFLLELHEKAKVLIDAFWKEGGQQSVEWK